MAVRKIPKNHLNVTGQLAQGSGRAASEFESLLEKDYLLLLQFDPEVESVEVQPIHVPVPGHSRPYTPDVLVRYKPGARGGTKTPRLIEVKPKKILDSKGAELRPKFRAASAFAKQRRWTFDVRHEAHIRTPRLENIKFLREYRRHIPDPTRSAAVLTKLRELGGSCVSTELVNSLHTKVDVDDPLSWYPVVWHLVYNRRVLMDFDVPMGPAVLLSLPRADQ